MRDWPRSPAWRTDGQLEALFERGALVDIAELQSTVDKIRQASAQELPRLWTASLEGVHSVLRDGVGEGFREALDAGAAPVLALIERDPDLAIFQVLRQHGSAHAQYGLHHATHAAITAWLVARRMAWSDDESHRVFKTALTMNLAMLELQGQLAQQRTPLTQAQRDLIHAHPVASRRLLEQAGVTDVDWLQAVEQHHEAPDGSGYPLGLRAGNPIATLVRRADTYTAKLSPRANRNAVAADKAGRIMFMQEPGEPMVAALVKEFGVYPPGCVVRLASGETAMVVKRGANVMTPTVAVLTTRNGTRLQTPERRDTAQKAHAVQSVLQPQAGELQLSAEQMMAVLAG